MTRLHRGALSTCLLLLLLAPLTGRGEGLCTLKGRVLDIEGKAVRGGEIFAYGTPQTRRPADYISRKTEDDGAFSLALPCGKYWLVARVRTGERFGPLGGEGKHSGEAREVEIEAEPEPLQLDFTVATVKEVASRRARPDDDSASVSGKILDQQGRPVPGAYAIATRDRKAGKLPEFMSAWSDETGSYALQLPPGKYYLGASTLYPPGEEVIFTDISPGPSTISSSQDIIMTLPESSQETTKDDSAEKD